MQATLPPFSAPDIQLSFLKRRLESLEDAIERIPLTHLKVRFAARRASRPKTISSVAIPTQHLFRLLEKDPRDPPV